MTAEQQNLKEQINTVNQFISSITESQNFEECVRLGEIDPYGKKHFVSFFYIYSN